MRVGDRRLIRYRSGAGFRFEYYDLSRDPGEQSDLYPDAQVETGELRALLDGYEEAMAARRLALAARRSSVLPSEQAVDPEREEKLRALGYVD